MTIRIRAAVTSIAVLPWAASCANAPADRAGTAQSGSRYEAHATVLDPGDGPILCLGGVAESLPPQCGGMPIHGWDWDAVEGEQQASGVTWGEFHVVGTYDGSSFTLERIGPPEAVPDDRDPFATPCPEPAGGWTSAGPATGDDDRIAAVRVAEGIPAFAGVWIDFLEEPVELEEPGPYILNVAFTGESERYGDAIREAWDGPLCLVSFEHTYRELRRAQADLADGGAEEAGLELLWTSVDVMSNRVELGVVVSSPEARRLLDETYGPGTIRVVPALRPV